MTDKLALFPLKSVLLPGCVLDLQIFEARYLDMLSRCFRQGQGFLVVTLEEGPEVGSGNLRFNALGCEARIIDWQQRDNGLLGIRVTGGRRGRASDVSVAADGLVMARVGWLGESADQSLDEGCADLMALRDSLLDHPLVASLGLPALDDSQQALGYQLAYLLPLSLEQKVELLAVDDPGLRLQRISAWLQSMQA